MMLCVCVCVCVQNRQQVKELRVREMKALSVEDYELGKAMFTLTSVSLYVAYLTSATC